jgi:hypothetical protein
MKSNACSNEKDVGCNQYEPTICTQRVSFHCLLWAVWGSLVSIMSDYKLDDWGSIPGRRLCVQTSCEAHPASYPVRTGVFSQ